ncbi:lipopolysaccharide biosynthesis protein [Alkalibacterium sp. f15]|uniref:lipopolysaccharide biosynthesis protein n=1 Tax=Alkalibacterium sp. f15 TaxID=3414029 RepID=UPI003BF81AE7
MNSYKKLLGNSFVFAIGRLGSKLISFFLVPVYTYYLSTAEFGTVDLVITTVSMLLPIVSASIFDAVLRFIMDDKNETDSVMMNALYIAIIGFLIALLFYPLIIWLNLLDDSTFVMFMYIILFMQMLERIFAEYARAIGEIKKFAINGILITISTGTLNILFLVVFGLGVNGYFVSMILAYLISIIYLVLSTKAYRHFDLSLIKKPVMKLLLFYSVPLIPNTLMWWLINASSRYFIRFFIGIGANGLFAVASRIPSLIKIFIQIFMQAWQLSAIEEFDSENKSDFYSNVFNYLSSLLFIGIAAILIVLKPGISFLFAADYYEAWVVVPFLLLGAVFSSFSSFLGTNYIAAKKTKGVFKTSVYGGLVSLVLNYILISQFGIIGAGISSMLSFFIIWILRVYDTREYIDMTINWKLLIQNLVIISLHIALLFFDVPVYYEIMAGIGLFLLILFVNRSLWLLLKKIWKNVKRKK